jgi:hypothetical protein
MKRHLGLLLGASILASCTGTSSGFKPPADLLAAANCASLNLLEVIGVYNRVNKVLASLPGPFPTNEPGVVYSWDGSSHYMITGPFGIIEGDITPGPGTVLADGLGAGDSATADWALNGGLAGVTLTGDGTFTVNLSATTAAVSGSGGILDDTCRFDYSSLNLAEEAGSTALTPLGTIVFTGTSPDGTLSGVITFNGSITPRVDATFNGVDYVFYIDLNTAAPIF